MVTPMPEAEMPFETAVGAFAELDHLDQVVYGDGIDTRYGFDVFDIDERPDRINVAYAFAGPNGILYIGAAPHLGIALDRSPVIRQARRMGACFLLVHTPAVSDFVPYTAAAERLIARYDPPLNR